MEWKPFGKTPGRPSLSTKEMMGGGGAGPGWGPAGGKVISSTANTSRAINTPYRPKSPRDRMLDDAVRQGIARSKAARAK